MRERPILFSSPMVRAILEGRKTQTRRVVKHQPIRCTELPFILFPQSKNEAIEQTGFIWPNAKAQILELCPYGQPGDRLWVREAFRFPESVDHLSPADIGEKALAVGYPKPWCPTQFEADGLRRTPQEWRDFVTPGMANDAGRLRVSMHMPRWASRILLEITGVRVERLQDISEEDAQAEGVANSLHLRGGRLARENFAHLWWTINGDGSWEANPWVWVVEFKRVTP